MVELGPEDREDRVQLDGNPEQDDRKSRGRGRKRKSREDRGEEGRAGATAAGAESGAESGAEETEVRLDEIFAGLGTPGFAKIGDSEEKIESERVSKLASIYAQAYTALFAIPAVLGAGEHWYLSSDESKQLGKVTDIYISSLPKARKQKITKEVAKYIPLFTLVMTLGSTIYGRAIVTIQQYKNSVEVHIERDKDTTTANRSTTRSGFGIKSWSEYR